MGEGPDYIEIGGEERRGWFHLIESAHINRNNNEQGRRILSAEIQISEWSFNSRRRKPLLTLHRDHFPLRKLIERRVYEIVRKMCGAKTECETGLGKLLKRTGACTKLKRFRHTLREIATHNHLPDYEVQFNETQDMVIFKGRGTVVAVNTNLEIVYHL